MIGLSQRQINTIIDAADGVDTHTSTRKRVRQQLLYTLGLKEKK